MRQPEQAWPAALKLAAILFLTQSTAPNLFAAATVWTGPQTNFSKTNLANPSLAANQDHLTDHVWITRGNSQGIYNAKTETFFTHFSSPADTEWADGTTANYNSLSYTNWNAWAKIKHLGPPSTVGVNAVLHLKSDDIYLDLKFTSWDTSGVGGAFSYTRSTPPGGNNPPSVTILNPTTRDGAFVFAFSTEAGHPYIVQFSPTLNPADWSTFTNFTGDGSIVQITHPIATNSGYYRVGAQ